MIKGPTQISLGHSNHKKSWLDKIRYVPLHSGSRQVHVISEFTNYEVHQ